MARLTGGVVVAFFIFFMIAMGSFSDMCSWTTGNTLFQSTRNSKIKVVERWYGCGATDSTPATRKAFKIVYITSFLAKVSAIDISKLDKEEWLPVFDLNGR